MRAVSVYARFPQASIAGYALATEVPEMERAVTVKGRVTDDRHIELDESLGDLKGPVEVTLRSVPAAPEETEDILDYLARLPGGQRSKADIDHQIREERETWKRPWDRDR